MLASHDALSANRKAAAPSDAALLSCASSTCAAAVAQAASAGTPAPLSEASLLLLRPERFVKRSASAQASAQASVSAAAAAPVQAQL